MKRTFTIPAKRMRLGVSMTVAAMLSFASIPRLACATSVGAIVDPAGDSSSHDVVSTTATFDATTMWLGVQFAPGTLNPDDLGFLFAFDLDQNGATGTQPPVAFPVGADLSLVFNTLVNTTHARIAGNLIPVDFAVDSLAITLPLNVLNDDGHANFALAVGDPNSENSFLGRDLVPDGDLGRAISTPTLFVPEPASCWLALVAVAGFNVAATRTRRRSEGGISTPA
jgi:hypothetical protein